MKKNWLNTKLLLGTLLVIGSIPVISQTVVNFPFTGGAQSWTVPNCVTSITITAGGAQGGNAIDGPGGGAVPGGEGAVVTATIPVNPGDIIDMTVGGQGGLGTALGFNGGGSGFFSSDGSLANASASGGGSTNVSVNGSPIIIAAGGGGAGGGSWSFGVENNFGGDGGCATGQAPSPGSPWIGTGGGGGTQFAPGAGGAPWAGVPPGGSAGIGGTGGIGGQWQTAPGGGGGGGYFGGGGGGNDGCCTSANGGAGGGGGSSLVPGGALCTQGQNVGNGYVTISYSGAGPTATISSNLICEGETVTLELLGATGTVQWQTAPTTAGPWVNIPGATTVVYVTAPLFADACYRAEETGGACSLTPFSNELCVAVSPAPTPNAGVDDSICFSATSGYPLQGVASVGGATTWSMTQGPAGTPTPPLTVYTPNSSNPNATANVNHPGMYTFTFSETDPTGVCPTATDDVQIFFAQETHTTAFVNPSCADFADGSITVTSTGNLGATSYSFDGGATFQASNTLGGLAEGTYTIVSSDILGCTFQSTVDLVDPPLVVVTVSDDTTICENGTATIVASATGGTSYLYHWSMTGDSGPVQPVSAVAPLTITVFAENEFGCLSSPKDMDITLYDPITATISPNDTVCPGYPSSHTVLASGGHLGFNYTWTANGVAMAGPLSTIDVAPMNQTEYCVTVSDGCESTPQVLCTNTLMREVPNPIFMADTTQGCNPTEIVFTNLTTLIAPAYIDSVTWNIGGVIYNDISGFTHEFTEIGSYDVWFEVYSNYGCYKSISVPDYITIHPNPEANFYANPSSTTIFDTEVDFNNTSSPGNNNYQWSFPGGNPVNSVDDSPTVVYPEEVAATYQVQLIVINEFMCSDTVDGIVEVIPDILIYVPNAFTPDGDEFNEYWRVYIDGIDIYDFHLTVYNRWGEIVWESYNPEGEWDGSYGTTEKKTGTYVWVIEAKDKFSDKKLEWRGHVTVLK